MIWRVLAFLGALTFFWTGVSTLAKASNECKHVVWGHQGTARFGTFVTTCYSDSDWALVKDPEVRTRANLELASDRQVKDPGDGMGGGAAGLLSLGGGVLLLMLSTWPLVLIPFGYQRD